MVASLQQRYAQNAIEFRRRRPRRGRLVPVDLFDSVADNLLQNALLKRQNEAGLARARHPGARRLAPARL